MNFVGQELKKNGIDIETVTGAQAKANQAETNAKNASVPRTGGTITNGDLVMDGGSVNYKRPNTAGGWARGFWWSNLDMSRIGGIGVLGSADSVTKFYIGYGLSPWSNSILEAYLSYVNINGKLRTQQTTSADVDNTVTTKKYVDDKIPTKLSDLTNDIGAGGGIKITTSPTAPSSPSPGDFWYKEV